MPWKEMSSVDQRKQFIEAMMREEGGMSAVASVRHQSKDGIQVARVSSRDASSPIARAVPSTARAVAIAVEDAIVAARPERPTWGPRKQRAVLRRVCPRRTSRRSVPSRSSFIAKGSWCCGADVGRSKATLSRMFW